MLLKMELQTPSGLEIPLCRAALEGSAVLQLLSLEMEGWDQLCRGAQTEATPTAAAPCPPPGQEVQKMAAVAPVLPQDLLSALTGSSVT